MLINKNSLKFKSLTIGFSFQFVLFIFEQFTLYLTITHSPCSFAIEKFL